MGHETKGSLLKAAQSPDVNAIKIFLFGPLQTSGAADCKYALSTSSWIVCRLRMIKTAEKVYKAVVGKSNKQPWITENRWSSILGIGLEADNLRVLQ
jgi:hypothetical protein